MNGYLLDVHKLTELADQNPKCYNLSDTWEVRIQRRGLQPQDHWRDTMDGQVAFIRGHSLGNTSHCIVLRNLIYRYGDSYSFRNKLFMRMNYKPGWNYISFK